jgi:hypothetical protein
MRLWLLLLLIPLTAHAEVMDKEPSLAVLSWSALIACTLSYFAARRAPWTLFAVLPASAAWFGSSAWETLSPDVGPAILAEAGMFRFAVPWVGLAAIVLFTALGLWRRRCAPNNSFKPNPHPGFV